MRKLNLSTPATRRRINALKRLKDHTAGKTQPALDELGAAMILQPRRSNDEHRKTLMKRISMGKI